MRMRRMYLCRLFLCLPTHFKTSLTWILKLSILGSENSENHLSVFEDSTIPMLLLSIVYSSSLSSELFSFWLAFLDDLPLFTEVLFYAWYFIFCLAWSWGIPFVSRIWAAFTWDLRGILVFVIAFFFIMLLFWVMFFLFIITVLLLENFILTL